METSDPKRHFSDIRNSHKHPSGWRLWFSKHGRIVNLRPTFYRKYQLPVIALIVLISVSAFAMNRIFTKGATADFYPVTCLGTWQDPQKAQDAPETTVGDMPELTPDNSAVLVNPSGEIFCGGFMPTDFEEEGDLKNVSLTLVWHVAASSTIPPVLEPSITPLEETSSTASSTASSTPTSSEPGSPAASWFGPFIAFAQEENVTTTPGSAADPAVPLSVEITPNASASEPVPVESGTVEQAAEPEPALTAGTETEEQDPVLIEAAPLQAELVPLTGSSTMIEATSTVVAPPTELVTPLVQPDENFLQINYSFDGQVWYELQKVNSNNWPHLTLPLPVTSWEELRSIQISVKGIPSLLETPSVLLDGMLMEIKYEMPPPLDFMREAESPEEHEPRAILPSGMPVIRLHEQLKNPNQQNTFGGGESPVFDLDLGVLPSSTPSGTISTSSDPTPPSPPETPEMEGPTSLWERMRGFWQRRAHAQTEKGNLLSASNPMIAEVTGPSGALVPFSITLLTVNDKIRVVIPEPGREFRPGKYKLRLWMLRDGVIYETDTDFSWGVLAVNFNQSIYRTGDTAKVGLGVLDDGGHTICDATAELRIEEPDGQLLYYSTENRKVRRNESCGPTTVTNEPDYSAEIPRLKVGQYNIKVTAHNQNGIRTINDSFSVEEEPAFEVERLAPTRIYPLAIYEVRLRIRANREFRGVVIEKLPLSFRVYPHNDGAMSEQEDARVLGWQVDMEPGEVTELSYEFDPPDVSPELFKSGPLEMGGWQETREWQFASDAAGDVILLWDGATIPTGWTCVSCAAGDPFFEVFPRGSSTYASASSSNDGASHAATFVSHTAGGSVSISRTGTLFNTDTHTHGVSGISVANGDIRPPFRNLKFIQANTSTLPNGTIGMFSVSSSSLPSGWSYYSAIENNYLRGENSSSTGGASEHGHTFSATADASADTAGNSQGGGTPVSAADGTHTHSISGSIANASNTPSYISVVFGKLGATSTMPDGLIAMFDATPPTDWTATSTMNGRLIRGGQTYGTTGGSATHTHATTTVTGGTPSAATDTRSGANAVAAGTHTHDFTFSVPAGTSLPTYRDVIFATYAIPNAAPSVSSVTLNGGSALVLTPGTTTTVNINFTVTDGDGCGDVFTSGGVTTTVYRTGVGASCTVDDRNCYIKTTVTHNCSAGTSANATATVDIQYFAEATDASSSYSGEQWVARVEARDALGDTGAATSSAVELNTLLAIQNITDSVSYSLAPGDNTGSTMHPVAIANTGNASTSLTVSGTALALGGASLPTSSQHYATSTFTFGGLEQVLSDIATAVSGFIIRPAGKGEPQLAWEQAEDIPVGLNENASAISGNYIYAIGGSTGSDTSTVSFSSLNATGSLSWAGTTPLSSALSRHSAAAKDGHIYVTGGATSGTGTSTVLFATPSATGSITAWTGTTALPTRLYRHASVIYDNYIYSIGGNASGTVTSTVISAPINATGSIGSWSQTTALPSRSEEHAAVAYNGYMYVIGGSSSTVSSANRTSSVLFAPINAAGSIGAWATTTPLPSVLAHHSAIADNGYLYVIGGANPGVTAGTTTVLAAPINATGSIGSWSVNSSLSLSVYDHGFAANSNFMYTVGGSFAGGFPASMVLATPLAGKKIYWGAGAPLGYATGTYSGTVTYTAVFEP